MHGMLALQSQPRNVRGVVMQEENLETVLRRLEASGLFGEARPSGEEHYSIPCPFARWKHKNGEDNRPSASVSFGDGRSVLRCHSCGVRYNLDKAVALLDDLYGGTSAAIVKEIAEIEKNQKLKVKPRQKRRAAPVTDYMELLRPMLKTPYPKSLLAFLKTKNIPPLVAKKFYCAYVTRYEFPRRRKGEDCPITAENALLLPVLKRAPEKKVICAGAQVRPLSSSPGALKYYSLFPFKSNRFLFGEHLLHLGRRKIIFLLEGGLDVMHFWSVKHKAYGLLGLYMSKERILKVKSIGARKIFIMLDPDQNERATSFKIQERLGAEGVEAEVLLPEIDPKLLTKNDLDNF